MVAVANALKAIPMNKITFLQLPVVSGLPAPNQGRVMPDYEKAQVLFDLLAADEPMVLGKVENTGSGAVVAPTPTPTATPKPSSTPTRTPTATPTPTITPLPDWAQGTNAATTTCSN
jgi:hypothetical protein